jgi:hypothetical protein
MTNFRFVLETPDRQFCPTFVLVSRYLGIVYPQYVNDHLCERVKYVYDKKAGSIYSTATDLALRIFNGQQVVGVRWKAGYLTVKKAGDDLVIVATEKPPTDVKFFVSFKNSAVLVMYKGIPYSIVRREHIAILKRAKTVSPSDERLFTKLEILS